MPLSVRVIAVGKVKERFIAEGIAEYARRLGRYCTLEVVEVADEVVPATLAAKDELRILEREGERVIAALRGWDPVVLLDPGGEAWSSEELAERIGDAALGGTGRVAFVIGGSLGVSAAVRSRATCRWSLSRLTFPHQLVRLILLEQVYRAFRIRSGEPYHR